MGRRRAFRPWRSNLRNAFILGALGIGSLSAAYAGLLAWPVSVVVCGLALFFASLEMRRWQSRRFGKEFEAQSLASAARTLRARGLQLETGRMAKGIGDIDLIVINSHGRRATIEIKSFVHWRQLGPFIGSREASALRQAAAQRASMEADTAVVWLPQGRPSLLQYLFGWVGNRDVTVLFGSAERLGRWLASLK